MGGLLSKVPLQNRLRGSTGRRTGKRRLLAACAAPQPKIITLTTFDLDEYVYDALAAGASGFLLKDVRAEQLVAGIRIATTGEALLAPAITQRLIAMRRASRPYDHTASDSRFVFSMGGKPSSSSRSRLYVSRMAARSGRCWVPAARPRTVSVLANVIDPTDCPLEPSRCNLLISDVAILAPGPSSMSTVTDCPDSAATTAWEMTIVSPRSFECFMRSAIGSPLIR
jgi:CheY-like chemotaxis protein